MLSYIDRSFSHQNFHGISQPWLYPHYIPIFFPVEIATFGHTQAPISIAGACVSCGYAGAEAMAQQHRIDGIHGADVDG